VTADFYVHRNLLREEDASKRAIVLFGVMGWLRLVGSIKLQVSSAKEPYKRDHILSKRPVI